MELEDPLRGEAREPEVHGDIRSRISTGIVQLHKEHYGRGPTRVKTYYDGDVVLVLMRGGFTTVEETLIHAGEVQSVTDQREAFQRVMRPLYVELIERVTGRKVDAFMSTTHQTPDMLAEVFILEPPDGAEDPIL